MRVYALGMGEPIEVAGFVVERIISGPLAIRDSATGDERVIELTVTEGLTLIQLKDWFCIVADSTEFCLIGSRGRSGGQLLEGAIPRLRLPGYDPGGLHRMGFWLAEQGLLVVETEAGVAWVDPEMGILGALRHDDLATRVVACSGATVELMGESVRWTIRLSAL